jgi:hypothetical protein
MSFFQLLALLGRDDPKETLEKTNAPIQGSRYVRAYCYDCGDPIRISRRGIPICNDCLVGHHRPLYGRWEHLTPRQWEALKKMGKSMVR